MHNKINSEDEEEEKTYDVFIRSWYVYDEKRIVTYSKRDGIDESYNRVIVPGPGEKEYIAHNLTRQEARDLCTEYNDSHDPGELSIKAEFEES